MSIDCLRFLLSRGYGSDEWISEFYKPFITNGSDNLLRIICIRKYDGINSIGDIEGYCQRLPKKINSVLSQKRLTYLLSSNNQNGCEVLIIQDEKMSKLDVFLMTLADMLRSSGFENIILSVGKPVAQLFEINESYETAKDLIVSATSIPDNRILLFEDINRVKPCSIKLNSNDYNEIIASFKKGDIDNLHKLTSKMTEKIRQNSPVREGFPYPTSIRRMFIEIIVAILQIASELGVDVDSEMAFVDPYAKIMSMQNTPQIQAWFESVSRKIRYSMDKVINESEQSMVNKLERLIESEIGNNQFSLEYAASVMHLSPSYLSWLFKKEVGVGFNEYVQKKRLNLAIDYLKQTKKTIFEVSSLTGFNSTNYFNKFFKRMTGKAPSAYRNSI